MSPFKPPAYGAVSAAERQRDLRAHLHRFAVLVLVNAFGGMAGVERAILGVFALLAQQASAPASNTALLSSLRRKRAA
ncbi:MAG: hypothetical protein NVS4B8_27120 [Herpetosiphon sp.]